MFQKKLSSVWESLLPDSMFFVEHRPTVAGILVTPNGKGIVLAQHVNGPAHTFIPPQGGIMPKESPGSALIREVREELPGVELDIDTFALLGDCVNEMPLERGDQPDKWMFWVAARCQTLPAALTSTEISDIQPVWSADHLLGFLESGQVRRKKRQMLLEAVNATHYLGLLQWGCDEQIFADRHRFTPAVDMNVTA